MKKIVLVSCFKWYEQRLKPIYEMLKENNEVTIFLSDFDHIVKKYETNRINEISYIHVNSYRHNLSLQRGISHYIFAKKVYKKLNEIKPDYVYALVPPNCVAYFCSKYKREKSNSKLIFDLIDLWPESMPLQRVKNTYIYRKWKMMRDIAFLSADHIFTECELYRENLEKAILPKCSTLYLFKKVKKKKKKLIAYNIENNQENCEKKLILGYLGSINYIIDIEKIRGLLKEIKKEYKVKVLIIGDGERRHEFLRMLENINVDYKFYGKVFDEKQKISILSKCDYGINIMIDSVRVGLTIKSIDYFSYGLPIINNIKGDTWSLVEKYNLGVNIDGNRILKLYKFKNEDRNRITMFFEENFTQKVFEQRIKKVLTDI